MAASYEGLIEIPLEEFWEFVTKYHDKTIGEIAYGIPRVNRSNATIEISFAVGTECHPSGWAKKPLAVMEWEQA